MNFTSTFQKMIGLFGVSFSLLGVGSAQTPPPSTPSVSSLSPMIYPAQGQTQDQLDKDKAECDTWARKQSGYDPMAAALQAQQPPTSSQPVPPEPRGGVVRGGARGAAAGAAIGAIAGDAGKGAAIGAASGGALAGIRQRQAGAAQQQATTQQQAAQQQALSQQQGVNQQKFDAYKRAFKACMEAKGYTVQW